MAYIVVSVRKQEVGRWPLTGRTTIGRATDCGVAVRDILLSRQHCQIAPYRDGWIASDLRSKNGTRIGRDPVGGRRGLADGDVLTMGNTTVRFQVGRLPAGHAPPPRRPADPFEALAGTVAEFDPAAVAAYADAGHFPRPRPVPPEPAAFAADELYGLMSEIASSSWDSIYAQASRPSQASQRRRRPAPRPFGTGGPIRVAAAATPGDVITGATPADPTPDVPAAPSPSAIEAAMAARPAEVDFADALQVPDVPRRGRLVRPAYPIALPPTPAPVTRRAIAVAASLLWPLTVLGRWVAPGRASRAA